MRRGSSDGLDGRVDALGVSRPRLGALLHLDDLRGGSVSGLGAAETHFMVILIKYNLI